LREVIGLFEEKVAAKGKHLRILIDTEAFQDRLPEGTDVFDTPLRYPRGIRYMTFGQALQFALKRIPTGDATFLVQSDIIVITSVHQATPARQTIHARFVNRPLQLLRRIGSTHPFSGDRRDRGCVKVAVDDRSIRMRRLPLSNERLGKLA
jgi:hypothetical protein